MHADSSLGQLNVVDGFQRRGLGGEVLRRVVAQRLARAQERQMRAAGEPGDMTNGWNMVDVAVGNAESTEFFRRLEGWEEAWATAWMTFVPPSPLY